MRDPDVAPGGDDEVGSVPNRHNLDRLQRLGVDTNDAVRHHFGRRHQVRHGAHANGAARGAGRGQCRRGSRWGERTALMAVLSGRDRISPYPPRRRATGGSPSGNDSATGSRRVKTEPAPGVLVAVMSPPSRRAFSRAIARPRPLPRPLRLRSALNWRSKTCGSAAAGMPGPASATAITA